MTARLRKRRGVVLFDVILGTTVMAIAGIAFVTLLGQNFATVDQLRAREREIDHAAEQLQRVAALWSAADFEARLGRSRLGDFNVSVAAVAPNLFDVEIGDVATSVTLLRTTFYVVDTTRVGQ